MTIDFSAIGKWMLDHWAVTTFLLSTIVQITPIIKFNPYSALLKWAGKILTSEAIKKIDNVDDDMKNVKQELEDVKMRCIEDEKDRIRWEVLDFANSCRNGHRHTRDEFQHIIVLNSKYERLLKITNDENGVFDAEYEYIKKLYQNAQDNNDFLS